MLIQVVLISLYLLIQSSTPSSSGWRGIIPLHSTRTDVERVLGAPGGQCNCIYRKSDELVYVEYADGLCKGALPGWNVRAGTVLSFTIRSSKLQQLRTVDFDDPKFLRTIDDAGTSYYTSNEEGIRYEVSGAGVVNAISYIPSTRDNHLRCPGFPKETVSTSEYPTFDSFSDIPLEEQKARLDIFAVRLQQEPESKGYIIVYAGRCARTDEASARAEQAKKYLVKERSINARQIVAIDGGHREKLTLELYALPPGAPKPSIMPTIAPTEVYIINIYNCF